MNLEVPKVSVVVPVYNRKELCRRPIQSLLDQDLCLPYEIVVVDDGSTDGTGEALGGMDSRIRVIRQSNQGAAVARHVGVKAARSNVVVFHDSDDLAFPCKLSALVSTLNAHPKCVAAFGITQNRKWTEGRGALRVDSPLDGRTAVIADPFGWLISHGGPIAEAMNLATYRDLCLKCSRGRSFYRAANDYDLQLRLARHGSFAHVARVTCDYTEHSEGISTRFGEFRQGAYALCSADEAFRHCTRQSELQGVIRERVEGEWPRIVLGLLVIGDWTLIRRILAIACRHARIWRCPRTFWWALDGLVETRRIEIPIGIVQVVEALRLITQRQRRSLFQNIP